MIRHCVDIFRLDLLTLCSKATNTKYEKNDKVILKYFQ